MVDTVPSLEEKTRTSNCEPAFVITPSIADRANPALGILEVRISKVVDGTRITQALKFVVGADDLERKIEMKPIHIKYKENGEDKLWKIKLTYNSPAPEMIDSGQVIESNSADRIEFHYVNSSGTEMWKSSDINLGEPTTLNRFVFEITEL